MPTIEQPADRPAGEHPAVEHLEIERKLDVDPSFALPDLSGVPGVAAVDGPVVHTLEATYFDTADLRLARARITLRRRTGGTDAGWHLKLPAAGEGRRERHRPLGRAANPPKALLEPVAGVLRGAPVVPVATLRTHRTATVLRSDDGRALAEVADDVVTATAPAAAPEEDAEVLSWREVEVELGDGDADLLTAAVGALTAAGARPSATASKAGRVLAGRLSAGEPRIPGPTRKGRPSGGQVVLTAIAAQVTELQAADVLLRTGGPDAVHRMRLAARRLCSLLTVPVLDEEAARSLRAELAELRSCLSTVRDDEVALVRLRTAVSEQPEELVLGPVAARIQQAALRAAAAGTAQALEVVGYRRYRELLDRLHALLQDPPLSAAAATDAGKVLRRALGSDARRLRRRTERVQSDGAVDDAAWHAVRTAAERTRDVAALARPVLGRPAKELDRRLRELLDVLGDRQDAVGARELCRRLGTAAFAAGENAWSYGRLHALEEAAAVRALEGYRQLEPTLRPLLDRARRKG